MFEIDLIRKILKEYIVQGVEQFIIYPFGINGVNVKNVLKDCFDLNPCHIVDNEYCRYNSNIIDSDMLRNVYQREMYIILTVENKGINSEMIENLTEFIPQSNIINILQTKILEEEKYSKDVEVKSKKSHGEGFLLCDFLPLPKVIKDEVKHSGKIKVRITHGSANNWNAISEICQAFVHDSAFETLLIVTNFNKARSIRQTQELGYAYVTWEKYQIEEDKPDILILTDQEDCIAAEGISCREYAKLIVVAYMYLVMYDVDTIEQFWKCMEKKSGRHRPDYYLFDSLLYKALRQSSFYSTNMIEMGNAKFDGIYRATQNKVFSGQWEKMRDKKARVLWTTTHGIYDKEISSNITFDLYAKTIFEYIDNHQEMGLIFRPHNGFIREMLENGFWSDADIQRLKKFCDDSVNIIYDDTDTYNTAMSIADGILTDAHCGVICSALPTLKPICAMHRYVETSSCYKDLWNVNYSAYEGQDIVVFFEMIKNGQDPMLELRKKAIKEYVKHFDGKNGWRIKEFVKNKYFELQNDNFE